jgi:hypothetical protein
MFVEHQIEDNWCWAAVAVSIHNFLNPPAAPATPLQDQGQLATQVLLADGQIPAGVRCDRTPGLCDYPGRLDEALAATGNLRKVFPNNHLDYPSLKACINKDLPVAARIVWRGGSAHFIVLDGYTELANGDVLISVQDPLYGPSLQYYGDLINDYPPGGGWQDTFIPKRGS